MLLNRIKSEMFDNVKHLYLVEDIVCKFGSPKKVLSDRGKNFLSDIMKKVYSIMNMNKLNTSSYHPQTDGLTERFNKTIEDMLSAYVEANQKDWDTYIPYVLNAYRTSPHATTKKSPFELLFGRQPNLI